MFLKWTEFIPKNGENPKLNMGNYKNFKCISLELGLVDCYFYVGSLLVVLFSITFIYKLQYCQYPDPRYSGTYQHTVIISSSSTGTWYLVQYRTQKNYF